jgi:hydroxymethylpyrimidine/phosphomethylpyrimidine kinase
VGRRSPRARRRSPAVGLLNRPLCLLTIAGSDSGGGAGLQADLKTFAAHGTYGLSVVTAITAQNTLGVHERLDLPATLVDAQLTAVLDDLPVDGIKIGMLGGAAIARAVARRLDGVKSGVPVVLDPVLLAGSGDRLLDEEALEVLTAELLGRATVVTPNLPEARALTGAEGDGAFLGRALARPGTAVLVKGGHGGGDIVEDTLVTEGDVVRFTHGRLRADKVHGTGCTLSSALAVRLARGEALPGATEGAIAYVRRAIEGSRRLGGGQWVMTHPVEVGAATAMPSGIRIARDRSQP